MLEIKTQAVDNIAIIRIEGELDLYNAPKLKKAIEDEVKAGRVDVIINLGKVPYIDSSGIGTFIAGLAKTRKSNGTLKMCNVEGSVKKVFELTHLTGYFQVFDNEDKAIASFKTTKKKIDESLILYNHLPAHNQPVSGKRADIRIGARVLWRHETQRVNISRVQHYGSVQHFR